MMAQMEPLIDVQAAEVSITNQLRVKVDQQGGINYGGNYDDIIQKYKDKKKKKYFQINWNQ